MTVFIEGGSKSGKSMYAQDVAKFLSKEGHLWYLATMEPHDDEDFRRIERHRRERAGMGFLTAEWGRNLIGHSDEFDCKGTYLVDSITTLLTNEMFAEMKSDTFDWNAPERVLGGLLELNKKADNVVFVSDNIFCDSIMFDDFTDTFRKALAGLSVELCRHSDCVYEFVSGNRIIYKGIDLI